MFALVFLKPALVEITLSWLRQVGNYVCPEADRIMSFHVGSAGAFSQHPPTQHLEPEVTRSMHPTTGSTGGIQKRGLMVNW